MKIKMILATLILALGLAQPALAQPAAKPAPAAPAVAVAKVYVELETSSGDIVLELDPGAAPITVENFVQYVRDGHYTDTIFHRVIRNFMIQGGGMDAKMQEKPTRAPIKNEADNGLKNVKYSVAMARTGDPNSATAQFFISTNDNIGLDFTSPADSTSWGYAVFGKVVKGQNVVNTIAKVKTGRLRSHTDVPGKTVTIKKAMILDGPPK